MNAEEARAELVMFAMQHVPQPEEFVDAILADRDLVLEALGGSLIHELGPSVWVFPAPVSEGDAE